MKKLTCIWIKSQVGEFPTIYCEKPTGIRKGRKDAFCPEHRAKADAEDVDYLLEVERRVE